MPKRNSKSKKKISEHEEEEKEFQNSEDEYVSDSDENSEFESDDANSEHSSQSGGDEVEVDKESELDSDSASLDLDPDDEKDNDLNDDETYDPINDAEELEDPDGETDIEEALEDVEETAADVEEGEIEGEPEAAAEEEGYVEAKPCHLKNLNKDFIILDEDDSNMYGKMEYKKIENKDRTTDPIMTYYEMVRIIGTRAQQFNFEAPPLVKNLEGLHPAKMAYIELISKMTPYFIRRHLPGKRYEDWSIDELEIIHKIADDFFVPENFDWESLMKQAAELNAPSRIIKIKKPTSKRSGKKKTNSKRSGSKKSGSKKSNSRSSKKSRSKKSNSKKSGSKRS